VGGGGGGGGGGGVGGWSREERGDLFCCLAELLLEARKAFVLACSV
jgi:hypothetical protein